MTAMVKTKSNYGNANGKQLDIVAFHGTIIVLSVPQRGFDHEGNPIGNYVESDFNMNEITAIFG